MTTEILRLTPGYRLRVVDLMREIELAEDCTLTELCLTIRDSEEIDLDTLSALLHCQLAPFIEGCLRPGVFLNPSPRLSAIEVAWQCEYDQPGENRWSPSTTLRLDVSGVGETWQDHLPGGQWYEAGKDVSRCNTYAIELTPLSELRHLPITISPTMRIACSDDPGRAPLEIPAPRVTLLQLLYALFWEFSFFGTPTGRDRQMAELTETVRQIESGEVQTIPFIWRQQDWIRNSLTMLALSSFSHQEVYGLNKRQLHEKLFSEHGVNWASLPTHLKNGTCVYQVPQIVRESSETSAAVLRTVWTIDREPPVFTQDRAYIERHVFLDRGVVDP